MTILCLDLGTTTGFAYLTNSKQIHSGFITFKISKNYGGGMVFLHFKRWLNNLKAQIPDLRKVYYEDVKAHKGIYAAHKYGGFKAILTSWCEHHNLSYEGVSVGTIKKHITGKGTSCKNNVIEAVNKLGYNISDHNEADALALLNYVDNSNDIF